MKSIAFIILSLLIMISCNSENQKTSSSENLYTYNSNLEPRWVSFENSTGAKGEGGRENNGAKGHPFDSIRAGATKILLDAEGPGIINRIWITINDRSPLMLRGLILNIYWDNEEKPAVSVPFGDFFGVGLGKTAKYENALFANPEGRSFNSFVQMPFKSAARIELRNESGKDLQSIFYDVNFQKITSWDNNFMYFHCFWHRDTLTTLTKDFEILPAVRGKGRFLGSNISIHANPLYGDSWWGEGEVKIYMDGDKDFPTLIGTGTEDYIGTAWGQGQYYTQYTGCPIADDSNRQWTFYRYHIPDPVYFKTDCRVTIQQMGGHEKRIVTGLQEKGVELIPVTIGTATTFMHLYSKDSVTQLANIKLSEGWVNFYRRDDLSAAAYFYLDKPVSNLPPIQPVAIRTWKMK